MHVPKYILWPQTTYVGTTLRPKYILVGHGDPQGYFNLKQGNPYCVQDVGSPDRVYESRINGLGFGGQFSGFGGLI